ncbi:MAG TPA: serine hydrolase domain-containing protein [Burkholderiaceae bacterium]
MSLKDRADSLLRQATESGVVPGVAAMVTDPGSTVYEGAFGVRALGRAAPMSVDTVVWIGSMTKSLTTAAAMQLVEQRKLDLDSPASEWVPELADVEVLEGFDAGGMPKLRPPCRPITLRHLLTHTAGFGYEFWSTAIVRYQKVKDVPTISSCRNAALRTPLLFDPGHGWQYGIGVDWAGKAVENASRSRLGAYLKEHVLQPLAMNDTAFTITPSMRPRLAKIHRRDGQGDLAPTDLELPQPPEFDMGGGGLYSTPDDCLKFVRMMLNRGRGHRGVQVLRPETVESMARNHIGDLEVRPLKTAMPEQSNDLDMLPGVPKTFGLGFLINGELAPTGRSAGSLAWAGLASTYFWIDPAQGLGGVYVTQILPFADARSLPLCEAFEQTVYRAVA